MPISRRGLLRGAAGFGLLPLMSSLRPARAGSLFPKRFIVFTHGQGTLMDYMVAPGSTEKSWDFGNVLAPLAKHKDDIVLLSGIDDQTNILDGTYNGHTRCRLNLLTAQGMDWRAGSDGSMTPASAGGPSIDQYVASQIGTSTQYSSLEFGVGVGSDVGNTFIWRDIDEPMPPENDPQSMYDRLFLELATTDPKELARLRARRQSVLDAVKANADHVRSKLGSEDKLKLDSHLESLYSVEQSLQGGTLGESCGIPELDLKATHELAESRAHLDMMAMALACDMTRVTSMCYGDPGWSWLDVDFDSGWHDAVHSGPASSQLITDLTATFSFFAGELAYLIDRLKEIPEGDGTLFDNTLILYANVFSDGSSHDHEGKFYLLAGGAAGALNTGRYLAYDGAAHNDLHVSILNALDIQENVFGNPDFCSGPLAGVL